MGGLEAELDFAPIDKVDVRNELRRFTMLPAIEADFQKIASYCNRRLPNYYIVRVIVNRPAGPAGRHALSRSAVTLQWLGYLAIQ